MYPYFTDRQVVLRILPEEDSYIIPEFTTFRAYMHAVVDETDQLTATFVDFFFLSPHLNVSVGSNNLSRIEQIQFSEDPHFDFEQIIKFRQDLRR